MIDLSSMDHIFLYPGHTDLRKGRIKKREWLYEKLLLNTIFTIIHIENVI